MHKKRGLFEYSLKRLRMINEIDDVAVIDMKMSENDMFR
jgi:hypothetical protein